MKYAEVLTMATKIKNFAIENDPTYVSIAQQFTTMPDKNIVNKRCQQKQSNLDAFFKTQ